jgi:hypothetical protein
LAVLSSVSLERNADYVLTLCNFILLTFKRRNCSEVNKCFMHCWLGIFQTLFQTEFVSTINYSQTMMTSTRRKLKCIRFWTTYKNLSQQIRSEKLALRQNIDGPIADWQNVNF